MPAQPKKKVTRHRIGNRRAGKGVAPPPLSPCPRCHTPRLTHRACPSCGTYRGRTVID